MEKAPVKVWDIVSIVAVIVLTFAFFPRIACSETPKGAIEDRASMACIPPEDKSSCENIPSGISEAERPIIQVYNECARMTQDPALQSKFFLIVSLLAMGPPGYAMVSKI